MFCFVEEGAKAVWSHPEADVLPKLAIGVRFFENLVAVFFILLSNMMDCSTGLRL